MSVHKLQTELETVNAFKASGALINSPAGYHFGFGTTVGNGIEGWAPNAIFIDNNAAQGSAVFTNTGTKASATWTEIADAGVAAGFVLAEAANIVLGTTTGTKIGTAAAQKLGFFGVTPVVQPAHADQDAVATTGATNSTPYGFTTSAQADDIITTLNIIRTALVAVGIIKGSA